MRKVPRIPAVALGWALLAGAAFAGPETLNKDNGFSAERAFHIGELDHINAFNGNLILTLPIGQPFRVGGGLEYGLSLVYNSNLWKQKQTTSTTWSIPEQFFNAGLGWRLSLGQLVPIAPSPNGPPWKYVAPDGNVREFWDRLHPTSAETPTAGIWYTRDGSYLRLNANARTLEFPDGDIHTFDANGRLTSMRDRFGNQLTVDSSSNPWILTDSHSRSHKIYFTQSRPYYNSSNPETPNHEGVVTSVELAAFGSDTAIATYTFGYANKAVPRSCPNTSTLPATVTVPVLTSVGLPDGSSYSIAESDYNTAYSGPCNDQGGLLRRLTLPTLGQLEWDFAPYAFPSPDASNCRDFAYNSVGVWKRRQRNPDGSLVGEWLHGADMERAPCSPPIQEEIRWARRAVTTPSGHLTEHFFSVSQGGSAGWDLRDYGLPFTRCLPLADGSCTASGPPFLSTRTYDAAGALVRAVYVQYEHDSGTGTPYQMADPSKLNQRLSRSRTYHGDPANPSTTWADTAYSDFDGFGNYRTTTLSGNYGAGDSRSETVRYNPGASGAWPVGAEWVLGTYTETLATEGGVTAKREHCFDPATGFLRRTRTLASGTSRGGSDLIARFEADAAGHTQSEWYYGGDRQPVDTSATALCNLALAGEAYRIEHGYESGSLKSSRYLDGSGVPLSFFFRNHTIDRNTGLVAASLDSAGLRTDYLYDGLGRLTEIDPQDGHDGRAVLAYTRATSAGALAKVRVTRLPNASGTTALAQEELQFDGFGRVSVESRRRPDGSWAARSHTYYPEGWKRSVSEWGSSAATRFEEMDPFGRPGLVKPPDGSPGNSLHDVRFSYFGDRMVVRKVHVGTSRDPVTGGVVEAEVRHEQLFDRQGRLWTVREPSGAGGAMVSTTYAYDVGGRLKSASTTSGALGQTRLFNYDNRGFLLSERHPEKGPSGNGYVVHCDYDARGHAWRRIDGNSGGNCGNVTAGAFEVSYTFDRAERLARVDETGGRVLKVFTYATANLAGNWRNGKLRLAERYNYVTLAGAAATALVRETYVYGGRGGRVSQRTTELRRDGVTEATYQQGWAYDDLGNVTSLGYPNATCSGCPQNVPRTVSFAYGYGLLTAVTDFTGAAGITYHPNGLAHQVAHANGVTWTQAADPSGLHRPAAFSTSGARNAGGAAANWQTDGYGYDGAGNVTRIGPSWFLYDGVSRLVSAGVYPGIRGAGPEQLQTYAYGTSGSDAGTAFGNIQSITTQVGTATPTVRNTPTSSSTNRLTGSATFDNAGNLTSWNGQCYSYDRLGEVWKVKTAGGCAGAVGSGHEWVHVYTVDGERLWSSQQAGGVLDRWTLRDLDGKVLREYGFDRTAGSWRVERDYVYRGTSLLAAVTPSAIHHFHPDHLGTPRLITDGSAVKVAFHTYLPFGEEATSPTQDAERAKFTGHERDLHAQSGTTPAADDLDYMHARYYNPQLGRFLSVDPVLDVKKAAHEPQEWNRYAYVRNRPTVFVDPTGETMAAVVHMAQDPRAQEATLGLLGDLVQAEAFREGARSFQTDAPASEKALAAAVLLLAAVDVGSNFINPTKGAAVKGGKIMIGHFPEYLEAAAKLGANVFNVPNWKTMTRHALWTANRQFLDNAIARGSTILLATDPSKIRAGSFLDREVRYLKKKGFRLVRDWSTGKWKFVPPKR